MYISIYDILFSVEKSSEDFILLIIAEKKTESGVSDQYPQSVFTVGAGGRRSRSESLMCLTLRTFALTVTAHPYCPCYTLGMRVPRQAREELETEHGIVLMAAAITWCENIFAG